MRALNAMLLKSVITACLLLFFLSGCQNNGENSRSETKSSSISFDYDMTALLAQRISAKHLADSGSDAIARSLAKSTFSSEQILRGQLSATAIGGNNDGAVEVFTWTIYLDETTLAASSNATLVFDPGEYDFELVVTKGSHQYAAYANHILIDGQNTVPMTIKPVIGDLIADVTIVDRLAYYKFNYPVDDFASLTSPSIGIVIDDADEQVFSINSQTGISDTFVNLPTGQHTLKLKLYDGGIQVGKSVAEQESQTVAFGTDLAMDIVPLYGEVVFALTEDGGDANIRISVPAEIIDEVGGINNLSAILAMVGVKNPLYETPLTFIEQVDGSYQADIVVTDLQYETLSLSIVFNDVSAGDQVASCNHSWTLSTQTESLNCEVTLIRRSVIQGDVLAVLGVNVMNEAGEPVSGTVVTNAAGDTLGITGSGDFGTAGYLKLYLPAGQHEITATLQSNGYTKTHVADLDVLEVENLLFELEEPPVTEPETIEGFVGDFAPDKWTISHGEKDSHSMNESLFTASINYLAFSRLTAKIIAPYDVYIGFDWKINLTGSTIGSELWYQVGDDFVVLSKSASENGRVRNVLVEKGQAFWFVVFGIYYQSNSESEFNNFTVTKL